MDTTDNAQPVPVTAARPVRKRRWILYVGLVFGLIVILLCTIGVLGGNVRTIQPGRAYRSATLTGLSYTGITARLAGNDLDSVLRRDKIGTVICLRAGSMADDWYRQEIESCVNENAAHVDIPMSARSLPPPGALKALLDTFDHTKYPVILHCQAGADRTGLASTIYANVYENLPLDRAESEELTWRYGHFPVDKTRAMDEFFDLYRKDSAGMTLKDWILLRYPQIYHARVAGSARR